MGSSHPSESAWHSSRTCACFRPQERVLPFRTNYGPSLLPPSLPHVLFHVSLGCPSAPLVSAGSQTPGVSMAIMGVPSREGFGGQTLPLGGGWG